MVPVHSASSSNGDKLLPTQMARKDKQLVEAARAAFLAAHSAASLTATGGLREAARLLRSSEALARAATAVYKQTVIRQHVCSKAFRKLLFVGHTVVSMEEGGVTPYVNFHMSF